MEQIKVLKLVSNEEIIAKVVTGTICRESQHSTYVVNPFLILKEEVIEEKDHFLTLIRLIPWVQAYYSKDSQIPIDDRHIIFDIEPTSEILKMYLKVVNKTTIMTASI